MLDNFFYEHSSHQSHLLEGLNTLRCKGELIDITLIVEGYAFGAHKAVLAACSDYFKAMFSDRMVEATQNEICLKGVTAKGFQQLLDYVYTSRLTLNLTNVQEVLQAASHVQMDAVMQACASYLESQIDLDNCVDIAIIAETYCITQLRMKVYRYMCSNLLEFSKTTGFYRLTPQQFEHLVDCDNPVDCSEADLFRIVLPWLLRFETNELDVRLTQAIRIIRHIRFNEISKIELDDLLDNVFEERNDESQLYKIILQEVYRQTTNKESVSVCPLVNSRGLKMALIKIGGFGNKTGLTNQITYCFPSERKWKHLTSIPHIDQCNFGTAVINNVLYIIGGCYNESLLENVHPYGFKYNPKYHKWSTMAPMKVERCRFSLNLVDGLLYAVGGVTETEYNDYSTGECYNPLSDSWYMIPSLPEYVTQHAGAGFENKLFISGGLDRYYAPSNQLYCYNVNLRKWKTCKAMLKKRADHVMLTVGKYLYVCGGWREEIFTNRRVLVDTIDVYDVEKDSWKILTKVPTPRYHAGIVCVDKKIYFVGGFCNDDDLDRKTAAIEVYDIDTDVWTVEEKYPQDIWEHTCTTLYIPKFKTDVEILPGAKMKSEFLGK